MHKICIESGYCQVTEQRLADQANQIRKKGWFSQAELEKLNDGHHLQPRVKVKQNQEQANQCLQKRQSDTISQEDVDDSNHEPTEEEKEHTHKTHNRFTALWILSAITRVSRYQKKHSSTRTHRGHQSSLSTSSIYYDPWHPPYSIHVLYSHSHNLSPSFLWSTSWPGTPHFIFP